MTATAASMAHITRSASSGASVRRAVRRPLFDLAPWIAPIAWMTVLAIAVCGLGAVAMLRDAVPSASPATIAVRVAPSDTLWSIAQANRLPGVSTARTVEAIARINGLKDLAIRAGAVLHIPTIEVTDAAFAQAESAVVTR